MKYSKNIATTTKVNNNNDDGPVPSKKPKITVTSLLSEDEVEGDKEVKVNSGSSPIIASLPDSNDVNDDDDEGFSSSDLLTFGDKIVLPGYTPPQEQGGKPKKYTSNAGSTRGRLRGRRPSKVSRSIIQQPSKSKSHSEPGVVTETGVSFIDEHGNKVWICPACGRQDDGTPMIGCEKCDEWYHFPCVRIVEAPADTDSWYCDKCDKTK